jgi:uncharacterized integral membrane protein
MFERIHMHYNIIIIGLLLLLLLLFKNANVEQTTFMDENLKTRIILQSIKSFEQKRCTFFFFESPK